ncbi:hypothetical protein BH10ACI2_BH10ACI2_19290 [soil metagenome]
MNCPNCGTPTVADQQFCRSCGAVLTERVRRRIPTQFWGLVLAFGGLMVAMMGKMVDLRWLIFAGVFILIGGMFLIATLSMLQQSRPRKRKVVEVHPPAEPLRADTTNKLLPIGENDFIPSVVEGTTDLLKTPVANSSASRD